jgi:hypothetical protein
MTRDGGLVSETAGALELGTKSLENTHMTSALAELTPETLALLEASPGGRALLSRAFLDEAQTLRLRKYQQEGHVLSSLDVPPASDLIPLGRPGFFFHDGVTHAAVRNLRHLETAQLELMLAQGRNPKDALGNPLQGHHHLQQFHREPGSMIVHMPRESHKVTSKSQHPYGNRLGKGLTKEQRAIWNRDRVRFNKALARTELLRRGVLKE